MTFSPFERLERVRASELRALPRDKTLIFIPVGPMEDHGDALPIGLDLFESIALAERTAEKFSTEGWSCLIAPAVPLGIDANTGSSGIRVRAHVLRDYLVDFSDSFARQGFRYFVALSGNPGPRQLTAIEEAGKFLKKRHRRFGVFSNAYAPILVSGNSVLLDDAEKSLSALFMAPKEHGGERDASIALATIAGAVDEGLLRSLPSVDGPTATFARWRQLVRGGVSGYWGSPARADRRRGEDLLEEKSKSLVSKLKAAIEGGRPHVLFKSWYSLIPTNQSLFRIWILVGLLATLLGAWILLSLESFLRGSDFR